MQINTFNFRWMLVILLAAFAPGLVIADPGSDYVAMCQGCHGETPNANPPPGLVPIDISRYTLGGLKDFIEDNMPDGTPENCTLDCAEDMAAYIEAIAIGVNKPPKANPGGLSRGEAPYTVTLRGTNSSDDNGIVAYEWDFGDGSPDGSGEVLDHTYTSPGIYEAILTVTDTEGLQDSKIKIIQVRAVGDPLVADASATSFVDVTRDDNPVADLDGGIPFEVDFNARNSYCEEPACSANWSFGDGSPDRTGAIAQGIRHTYETAGTYTATLTLTDKNGLSESTTIQVIARPAESFASYVETCKSELEFDDHDIPTNLNCAKGELFTEAGPVINDFVEFATVTDQVDLVVACRWLQNTEGETDPPFVAAASIEMILHNRENGNTCFFKAKNQDIEVEPGNILESMSSVNIVSPTVAANALPGTPDAKYWDAPVLVKRKLPCVDCHVAGPYIVSERIAPALNKFGLLNNGHDTRGLYRDQDNPDQILGHYNIVGETFESFIPMAADFNLKSELTCADGCHAIGLRSEQGRISRGLVTLLPGIVDVISGTIAAGIMPANNPETGSAAESHYTWINRDTPLSGWNDSDIETFASAQDAYPTLLEYCDDPGFLSAHTVGSDEVFYPNSLPDAVRTFNAKEGLVCINEDQVDGICENYTINYQCSDPDGNTSWSGDYNVDSEGGSGDHENRSAHNNVCTNSTVTGIRATFTSSFNGWTYSVNGPMDRLAKFDRYGLICNNNEQIDGQCSNYVVKFAGCGDAPTPYTAKIESAWSGRVLTAAASGNNGDTRAQPNTSSWDSQTWMVEPLANTAIVRLKNTSTGRYLNAQDDSDYADVVLYDFVEGWGSQQWIVEPISGSSQVRFKNVWSGKYLTVNNDGDYADIRAQPLNLAWSSQRWTIQE